MPLYRRELGRLEAAYWRVVAVAAVFTIARFSEAFLVLRAQSIGLPLTMLPIVLVIMSVAYSVSAYPVGVLSDRVDRRVLLMLGLILLFLADLVLAFATSIVGLGVGVMLWGLHMGFTQGLLTTLIAEAAPPELRGTAFGIFNLVTGLALLAASIIAGSLWDMAGPQGTFLAGAAFALLTLAGLFAIRGRLGGLGGSLNALEDASRVVGRKVPAAGLTVLAYRLQAQSVQRPALSGPLHESVFKGIQASARPSRPRMANNPARVSKAKAAPARNVPCGPVISRVHGDEAGDEQCNTGHQIEHAEGS